MIAKLVVILLVLSIPILFAKLPSLNENYCKMKTDYFYDTLYYKNKSLVIKSEYVGDSVLHYERNILCPVIISQKLLFYHKDKLINEIEHNVKVIEQKTYNNGMLKMLDNVIYEVRVLEGLRDTLFSVYGSGGCNSCNEYYSYFNLNGEILFTYYGNRFNIIQEVGNFDSINLQCGFNDTLFNSINVPKIDVYWFGRN